MKKTKVVLTVGVVLALAVTTIRADDNPSPSREIVDAVVDVVLAGVLTDVLERNPEIAAAQATAGAAAQVAPQRRALPDPEAQLIAFVLPPETRVGPQRAAASVSQRLPGGSKRKLARLAAEQSAQAGAADVEALRIRLVTEARRHYHEIGYLDAAVEVLETDRATLSHFEELARARYASGSGLQQEVVSIQADITRIEAHTAEIREIRASRVATLNLLRGRPGADLVPAPTALEPTPEPDWVALRGRALATRPELRASSDRIEGAGTESELAARRGGPDFSVGVTYAWVDPRSDVDVPDNGQDVFGITGGITIPVWRAGVEAGVEEATQKRLAAEALHRGVVAEIDRELEALRGRIPQIDRRIKIFEGVLRIQAEQALRSAEAAYATGRIAAVALLDSERTLLDVRIAAARSRADLAVAVAELEGAIAGPLTIASAEPIGGSSLGVTPAPPSQRIENRKSKIENPSPGGRESVGLSSGDGLGRRQFAIRNSQFAIQEQPAGSAETKNAAGGAS